MLILHTSDWHLGHTLYNSDRTPEQLAMLGQIEAIVASRRPDALIVSGDVCHTSQPSAAVLTMLSEAIVRLRRACPDMAIVMTAGNHDSASRHEVFRMPWRALGVHMVGSLDRDNPSGHIIDIAGKGRVVAVPYVNERSLPEGFFQSVIDLAREGDGASVPLVLMAHTTVGGCDFTGHDNASELTVGGIESLSLAQMGTGYDYLALGHIHNAQTLRGSHGRARYSGTPLAVNFDERFDHTVSLVTIDAAGAVPEVETVAIDNPRPLVTLPAEGFADPESALRLLSGFPADIPAYIRLNVEVNDFLPADTYAIAQSLTEGKECRLCVVNARRRADSEGRQAKAMTVEEFRSERPVDLARRYAADKGVEFDDELAELFAQAVNMINDEIREL